MAKPITVSITGNAGPLKKAVGEADTSLGKLGASVGKMGKLAAIGFAAAATAGVLLGKKLISAGEAAATSNARIAQINESMGLFGDQAKAVTDRLVKLAEATARNTGVDQNAIKLTQAKLLTFGELAKTAGELGGQFDRATAAAIDLAAAGFGEASANAVQLGKALQDPIKGITALAKSGVSFTESEKLRIETLVESNKIGEAQQLILAAIETQVGGTAAATANASDKMKVVFSQLQEQLGGVLLPIFERFTSFLVETVFPYLRELGDRYIPPIAEALGVLGSFITDKIVPAFKTYFLPVIKDLSDFVQKNLIPAFFAFAGFIKDTLIPIVLSIAIPIFEGLAKIFTIVAQKIDDNREKIIKYFNFLQAFYTLIKEKIAPIVGVVLKVAFEILAKAIGPAIDIVFLFIDAFASIGSFLVKVANGVLNTIESMVNGIISGVNKAIDVLNLLPGVDIGKMGTISISLPTISAPSAGANTVTTPKLADRLPSPAFIPTPSGTTIPTISSGSRSGSSSGSGSISSGTFNLDPAQFTPALTDFQGITTTGIAERIAARDASASTVNITVNAVTADAGLPNLIVEQLQLYNLISGPVDVNVRGAS